MVSKENIFNLGIIITFGATIYNNVAVYIIRRTQHTVKLYAFGYFECTAF